MKKGNSLLIGYARVSKADAQDTAAQVKALRQAGCKRIFEEKASGGRWDRPELHKALEQLREGDVLVVWKLDRLSRSLKDLLHIMERVREAGAGFRSLTEAVDTPGFSGCIAQALPACWRARWSRTWRQEQPPELTPERN